MLFSRKKQNIRFWNIPSLVSHEAQGVGPSASGFLLSKGVKLNNFPP